MPAPAIAVVGLAVRFPGSGPDLAAFWRNVASAADCSTVVPPGRWLLPPDRCTDPRVPHPDSVYSARGYYLDEFAVDAAEVNVPAEVLDRLDPLFHLVLDVGVRAWRSAKTDGADRRKAGVVLGNICLPTDAASALARKHLTVSTPSADPHPLNRHAAGLPAGLLAQALGLGGGAFTLDAACASTLYAIKLACDELLSGRADVMLAGGANRSDCQYTQMGFAQLRALSASGRCSPFDAAADGLMVGEGAGVFVLKRLADAVRDGDEVHCVLRGWGLSNDTAGNLLAPAKEGQVRAMRAAYAAAGWEPHAVDLIECHATGTPVGDAVEFDSLREVWGDAGGRAVIGSVKSTVGHLLTGAGTAALTKIILAMKHGTLPPQANFAAASPALRYADGPFRVLAEPQVWERRPGGAPRRAAVSGFGFGGVNAHLLVEEFTDRTPVPAAAPNRSDEPIAVVGLAARVGPWDTTERFAEVALGGGEAHDPKPKRNGWGDAHEVCPAGQFIEGVAFPLARFRIPPREIEEMLPQQLLMLQVAAAAMDDAGGENGDGLALRTGAFVGLGLDLNTTNFHLRWAALAANEPPRFPPLTADRTMGALGSIAASRIARTFGFGGPSFTCCSEESSSGTAVQLAVRALRLGEIDRAVAGGVDLTGDPRQMLASSQVAVPADGAAAVVLKRLSDAERDGDRVYAVIRGVGAAVGGEAGSGVTDAATYASSFVRACADGVTDPAGIEHLDAAAVGDDTADRAEALALDALLAAKPRPFPLRQSASRTQVGHTGAASTAVALVRACLALHHHILPPTADECAPRYWLADADTPRRAAVAGTGADGSCVHVVLEEHADARPITAQPLGARTDGLFVIDGNSAGEVIAGLTTLTDWLTGRDGWQVERLARGWFRERPPQAFHKLAATCVARDPAELRTQLTFLLQSLRANPAAPPPTDLRPAIRDRVFFAPAPVGARSRLAFVYPGSGNQFPGMGRDFGVQFPDVLRAQQAENRLLRGQYSPDAFWTDAIPPETTAKQFLFGQVTLDTLVSETLVSVGLQPDAVVGLSLGESAGLFGVRAWTSRDEMFERVQASDLFGPDLGPPYRAARRHWHIPADAPFDWVTAVVQAPAAEVRELLAPGDRVSVLIANTPTECVVGGPAADVATLGEMLGRPLHPLTGVTLAHCAAGGPVKDAYHALHTLPVTAPPGLKVYGSWLAYLPTEANAADSITAGLLNPLDFPATVEAAYRDGVRGFVEVGPGNSCTRMIASILGDRSKLVRAACATKQDATSQVLRTLAAAVAERFPVDLAQLYGGEPQASAHREPAAAGACVVVPVGLPPDDADTAVSVEPPEADEPPQRNDLISVAPTPEPTSEPLVEVRPSSAAFLYDPAWLMPFVEATVGVQAASAEAHDVFLRLQDGFTRIAAGAMGVQVEVIRRMTVSPPSPPAGAGLGVRGPVQSSPPPWKGGEEEKAGTRGADVPRSLTFEQCTEYAVGKIGSVLGPLFAEVDSYPTRVRLPEGPLMLVDRVLSIEGEPKSMTSGRVVTDHAVRADRWYLDNGRCPTSITVEAGQADLFLSGFLGIDFHTRGKAVYRLLDAVVTFHRGLPSVGERIEYDIRIDEFFRQGESWLFRFRFEGTVNGEPLLSMANGVAGFFTAAALAAGQGIVHTKLDKQPLPGKKPDGWAPLVPFDAPCSLDAAQMQALRDGDLVAAFGEAFRGVNLTAPMKLPGGMLRLVDRVPWLDPTGGRFGLGFVRAEYDIRPKEWFIECHFVDDKVMPGTLMYECCLHTLRVLLMRLGWVAEEGEAVCQPVPGVRSRLKCRGQVLDTTKLVTYEVSLKEIGYGPEPYCVADALMYADGKPIVEITNLSLRMSGLTEERLEQVWATRSPGTAVPGRSTEAPAVYDEQTILAYSNGNPSEAFGEPYKVFDRDRVIARLPGPPYQFLDRITAVSGEPFVLKDGAACTAEYAVPPGEWYFDANRCLRMPFSVLLEVALQPCGWLAAYCGSALTSDTDLSFRNLGGKGVQLLPVGPDAGTLTTTVTMTKVSKSAGMIIQNYDMKVSAGDRVVYEGDTYFGFFAKDALRNQVGMPQAKVPFLTDDQKAFADRGTLPHDPPFPAPMLRMVDRVDGYLPRGGKKGLGLIQGRIAVDPTFWFFKAHFYQDPVWPGSLGLESFLQLLKYVAWKRWKAAPPGGWQTVAPGRPHSWTYRGQVVPTDKEVTVVLEITAADDAKRTLTADGYLTVDGRIIYHMQDFTLE